VQFFSPLRDAAFSQRLLALLFVLVLRGCVLEQTKKSSKKNQKKSHWFTSLFLFFSGASLFYSVCSALTVALQNSKTKK
jgi:uncharacterized membrane protein YadS